MAFAMYRYFVAKIVVYYVIMKFMIVLSVRCWKLEFSAGIKHTKEDDGVSSGPAARRPIFETRSNNEGYTAFTCISVCYQ